MQLTVYCDCGAQVRLSPALSAELAEMRTRFDAFRNDLDEGMAGSPGEWMVERMDELETELKRRKGLR